MSSEEIRTFVLEQYVKPARQKGEKRITIRAGDVHDVVGLKGRQPLVCDTLRGRKLQDLCRIRLLNERWGRNVNKRHAKNIWFTYEL